MPSREIYRIGDDGARSYAGYARFDAEGNYLGSRGGYGPSRRGINADYTGNNRRNDASALQNAINTARARSMRRNPAMRRYRGRL